MGVRFLTSYLRPFATNESLREKLLVVDGNALAFHVYSLILNDRPYARNAFDAVPMYHELGERVIRWLDVLRVSSLEIKRIYFDGFLPQRKLATRLGRLLNSTNQLFDYHRKHPNPCGSLIVPLCGDTTLFGPVSVPGKHTSCAAAPFLVPAILESLYASEQYKNVTEIVPWEADLYCAIFAREHGGLILTGDSDLLLHDLGSDGAVCFFKDIRLAVVGDDRTEVVGAVHRPTAIAKRLNLDEMNGLRSLAFEILMNSRKASFPRLLAQGISLQAATAYPVQYKEFLEEYLSPSADTFLPSTADVKLLGSLRRLDPRVSEYVLQFPCFAKLAGQPPIFRPMERNALNIFLPFLLDCPVRTSAWEVSTATRKLAYGMMNLVLPEDEQIISVIEHKKKQGKRSGRELHLLKTGEISIACARLLELYSEMRRKVPDLPAYHVWTALTIVQNIEWSQSQQESPLDRFSMKLHVHLNGNTNPKQACDWDMVHLCAQMDASLYSFRILWQISGLVIASQPETIPEPVFDLHLQLSNLPTIKSLLDRESAVSFLSSHFSCISEVAHKFLDSAELSYCAGKPLNAPQRKGESVWLSPKESRARQSYNPFALLMADSSHLRP